MTDRTTLDPMVNADQRYASNSETQALFRDLCRRTEVPVQTFGKCTDLACRSTIGPITAEELGVRTLDVGVPAARRHRERTRRLGHQETQFDRRPSSRPRGPRSTLR